LAIAAAEKSRRHMSDSKREVSAMPDGRRKRRFSPNPARRRWYALHRSRRFCERFGWGGKRASREPVPAGSLALAAA